MFLLFYNCYLQVIHMPLWQMVDTSPLEDEPNRVARLRWLKIMWRWAMQEYWNGGIAAKTRVVAKHRPWDYLFLLCGWSSGETSGDTRTSGVSLGYEPSFCQGRLTDCGPWRLLLQQHLASNIHITARLVPSWVPLSQLCYRAFDEA